MSWSQMRRRASRISCLTITLCGVVFFWPRHVTAQWTSYSSNPRNLLEGNWQSCPEPDGRYSERVYDHVVDGVGQFEVHLGPGREFAIFAGVQDEHRNHDLPVNLLKPFRVPVDSTNRASRHWEIPALKLAFTVTLGGGSSTECESWYVVLEPLEKTSH
jgi:hypothetical protein